MDVRPSELQRVGCRAAAVAVVFVVGADIFAVVGQFAGSVQIADHLHIAGK